MISLLIAMAAAAPTAATVSTDRKAFVQCLRDASNKAKSDKIALDGFDAFAMVQCQAQANTLKDALIGVDVSRGVARKTAASDAQLQVEDHLASAKDNYQLRMESP